MSISSPEEVVSDRRPVSQDSLAAPNTVHTRSPVHSQEGIKSTSANGNAETSQAHPVEDTSPDSGQGDSLTPHAAAEGGSDNKESSPEVESAGLSDEAPSSASPSSAKRAQALEPTTVSYPSQGSSPGSGSDGDDEDEDEEGEISDNAMQESDQESETAAETRPQEAHIASKVASKTQSPEFDPPATNSLPLTSDSDMMEEDDEDYEPADALPPMTNGTLSDAHDGPEAMAGIERHGESDATPASVRASSRPLYTNDADATNHMVGRQNTIRRGY